MKINLKSIGLEIDGDAEDVSKHAIDKHEENWEAKFNAKHNAKKEMIRLKHELKMDEKKNSNGLWNFFNKKQEIEEKKENSTRNVVKVISIILFFVYGIFAIPTIMQFHLLASIIGFIQIVCVVLSLFSAMNVISLFEKDYKVLLIVSLLLIIPWLAFFSIF